MLDKDNWNSTHLLWTLFFSVVISSVIVSIQAKRTKQRKKWPTAPGKLPFLGHAMALKDSDQFYSTVSNWASLVGKDGIFDFFLFGRRNVVLCSNETVMESMRLRPNKLRRMAKFESIFSDLEVSGIFDAEGHTWRQERRIISPALNRNQIKDYFSSIKLVAKRLVEKWEKDKDNTIMGSTDFASAALDVVALSILGVDLDNLNDPGSRVASAISNMFHTLTRRLISPFPYWKIPLVGPNLDGGKKYSKEVLQVIRDLVCNYRKKLLRSQQQKEEQQQERQATKALLEKAIDISDADNEKLNEERMVGNLFQLIMAGTDTTSSTLSFCIWDLTKDSGLQDELYKEISKVNKDLDDLTLDDVFECFPKLRSFLFEVLRTKGPGVFLFLEPTEFIEFQGEIISPRTTICSLLRWGETKSEVPLGPNGEGPDEYCPRRWLVPVQEEGNTTDQQSLIIPSTKLGGFISAFGHGPRICPGKQLAEVEILTILIFILKTFEVAAMKDHPPLKVVTRFSETFDREMKLSLRSRLQQS